MPYCPELWEFSRGLSQAAYDLGSVGHYLGEDSLSWNVLQSVKPPADAVLYDQDEREKSGLVS